MWSTFVLVAVFLCIFLSVTEADKLDWAQWGRNPQFSSNINVSTSNTPHERSQWNFTAGDRVVGSPAIGFGRVCFGSDDGYFRCLDQVTGRTLWEFQVPPGSQYCESASGANWCEHGLCACNKIRSDPAMAPDGSLFFGSYDHNLYKLNAEGKFQWKHATGGAIYGPVTLDTSTNTAFVGSFDSRLYAVDAETGKVKWATDIGAHGDSGWALGEPGSAQEDLVFGQSNEGGFCTSWPPPDVPGATNHSAGGGYCYVYAINKTSGDVVWKVWTGTPGAGGTVAGDLFVTGSWNEYVVAYVALTGKVRWYFNAGGSIESHPALTLARPGETGPQQLVLISTEDESKTLFALDLATGKQVWSYTGAAEELNSSPSVTADTVFVGSNDRHLHAVDAWTGVFKFKYETCANVFSSAAIDRQGIVYVGCNTVTGTTATKGVGALYAINPALQRGAV